MGTPSDSSSIVTSENNVYIGYHSSDQDLHRRLEEEMKKQFRKARFESRALSILDQVRNSTNRRPRGPVSPGKKKPWFIKKVSQGQRRLRSWVQKKSSKGTTTPNYEEYWPTKQVTPTEPPQTPKKEKQKHKRTKRKKKKRKKSSDEDMSVTPPASLIVTPPKRPSKELSATDLPLQSDGPTRTSSVHSFSNAQLSRETKPFESFPTSTSETSKLDKVTLPPPSSSPVAQKEMISVETLEKLANPRLTSRSEASTSDNIISPLESSSKAEPSLQATPSSSTSGSSPPKESSKSDKVTPAKSRSSSMSLAQQLSSALRMSVTQLFADTDLGDSKQSTTLPSSSSTEQLATNTQTSLYFEGESRHHETSELDKITSELKTPPFLSSPKAQLTPEKRTSIPSSTKVSQPQLFSTSDKIISDKVTPSTRSSPLSTCLSRDRMSLSKELLLLKLQSLSKENGTDYEKRQSLSSFQEKLNEADNENLKRVSSYKGKLNEAAQEKRKSSSSYKRKLNEGDYKKRKSSFSYKQQIKGGRESFTSTNGSPNPHLFSESQTIGPEKIPPAFHLSPSTSASSKTSEQSTQSDINGTRGSTILIPASPVETVQPEKRSSFSSVKRPSKLQGAPEMDSNEKRNESRLPSTVSILITVKTLLEKQETFAESDVVIKKRSSNFFPADWDEPMHREKSLSSDSTDTLSNVQVPLVRNSSQRSNEYLFSTKNTFPSAQKGSEKSEASTESDITGTRGSTTPVPVSPIEPVHTEKRSSFSSVKRPSKLQRAPKMDSNEKSNEYTLPSTVSTSLNVKSPPEKQETFAESDVVIKKRSSNFFPADWDEPMHREKSLSSDSTDTLSNVQVPLVRNSSQRSNEYLFSAKNTFPSAQKGSEKSEASTESDITGTRGSTTPVPVSPIEPVHTEKRSSFSSVKRPSKLQRAPKMDSNEKSNEYTLPSTVSTSLNVKSPPEKQEASAESDVIITNSTESDVIDSERSRVSPSTRSSPSSTCLSRDRMPFSKELLLLKLQSLSKENGTDYEKRQSSSSFQEKLNEADNEKLKRVSSYKGKLNEAVQEKRKSSSSYKRTLNEGDYKKRKSSSSYSVSHESSLQEQGSSLSVSRLSQAILSLSNPNTLLPSPNYESNLSDKSTEVSSLEAKAKSSVLLDSSSPTLQRFPEPVSATHERNNKPFPSASRKSLPRGKRASVTAALSVTKNQPLSESDALSHSRSDANLLGTPSVPFSPERKVSVPSTDRFSANKLSVESCAVSYKTNRSTVPSQSDLSKPVASETKVSLSSSGRGSKITLHPELKSAIPPGNETLTIPSASSTPLHSERKSQYHHLNNAQLKPQNKQRNIKLKDSSFLSSANESKLHANPSAGKLIRVSAPYSESNIPVRHFGSSSQKVELHISRSVPASLKVTTPPKSEESEKQILSVCCQRAPESSFEYRPCRPQAKTNDIATGQSSLPGFKARSFGPKHLEEPRSNIAPRPCKNMWQRNLISAVFKAYLLFFLISAICHFSKIAISIIMVFQEYSCDS